MAWTLAEYTTNYCVYEKVSQLYADGAPEMVGDAVFVSLSVAFAINNAGTVPSGELLLDRIKALDKEQEGWTARACNLHSLFSAATP